MKKIIDFYFSTNLLNFIIANYILLLLIVLIPFVTTISVFNIPNQSQNPFTEYNNKYIFLFFATIIVPLIETFIFQYGIIKTFTYFKPSTKYFAVLISAILFSLSHSFNIAYIIFTFMMGLFFGGLYLTSEKRGFLPFWIITCVHGLYNLTVFILKEYF